MEQPVYLDGQKVIILDQLPADQYNSFSKYITASGIIAVERDNLQSVSCAAYTDYKFWYQNHFNASWTLQDFL